MTGQRGTSRRYALARLRREAPALLARVESGELSAHAAMVKAGLRPRSFTVRMASPEAVAEVLRRQLPNGWVEVVAQRLSTG